MPTVPKTRPVWHGQGELFPAVGRVETPIRPVARPRPVVRQEPPVRPVRPARTEARPVPAANPAGARPVSPVSVSAPEPRIAGDRAVRFLSAGGAVDGLAAERVTISLMGKRMGDRLRLWGGRTDSVGF